MTKKQLKTEFAVLESLVCGIMRTYETESIALQDAAVGMLCTLQERAAEHGIKLDTFEQAQYEDYLAERFPHSRAA